MTSPQDENLLSSLESTASNEFMSINNVPPIDIPEMVSTPRTAYSSVSSSEVFSTSSEKQQHSRALLTTSSSIPLPVKRSDPIKNPLILKNTRSTNKNNSSSTKNCTNTISNKHTLEIKFINTNKRYLQLKKELIDKQKPVVHLYKSLLDTKKKLEEWGQLVTLEDIELVPYKEYNQPLKFDGAGEQVPLEILHEMKGSVVEIPKTLVEVCQKLLNRSALLVELLDKLAKSEVDIGDVAGRIEPLKSEGQQLEESLEVMLREHEKKVENLVANWGGLLHMEQSRNKVTDLELKLKEKERVIQESNHVIVDLKKNLDETKVIHSSAVVKLNETIKDLRIQIKKLEQDIESERKASTDARTRNSSNAQNIKLIRAKLVDLENEKKNSEAMIEITQKKLKSLQEQLKAKEFQCNKVKGEMSGKLRRQEIMLQKLSTEKNEIATMLAAIEAQKHITEEKMQKTIEVLTEQLCTTKTELEHLVKERDAALGKCASFEGYVARMDDDTIEQCVQGVARNVQIQQLEDKNRYLEEGNEGVSKGSSKLIPTDCIEYTQTMQQIVSQQECINRYRTLLQEGEEQLRSKTNEIANLQKEIMQLQVRQQALEDQNNTCLIDQLQSMIDEGRQKLSELTKQSIETRQSLEHNANVIEQQTRQMSQMENLLRYREKMAEVFKASRDKLVLEKESLARYSQEMKTALGEVNKKGKTKDRLIKELQKKINLRERQITKLETDVRVTNQTRFKLQEAVESLEKELQNTRAYVNYFADINQRAGGLQRLMKEPF
ncbi:putative leucine-rich repeat-containing protein DDB_G0290503 [Euwallacea fornicatus]|uniref:putative leucine-rich repeat-containing protein DDB_G0290503 n=1 Tax=Euwallacea fornicatus TaxID=995702 RepID=UPI00338F6431